MTDFALTCPECGAAFHADLALIARISLDQHIVTDHAAHPAGSAPAATEGEPS